MSKISIHALREEGDPFSAVRFWLQKVFLSTPSARRATRNGLTSAHPRVDFYPRPPRGGRQQRDDAADDVVRFLSTPSARRATRTWRPDTERWHNFYPRPPRGGRPSPCRSAQARGPISIPALREEGDSMIPGGCRAAAISIPALREEGDATCWIIWPVSKSFLSPPSARRATTQQGAHLIDALISIPALREEGDSRCPCPYRHGGNFYPRPPRGGRPRIPERV